MLSNCDKSIIWMFMFVFYISSDVHQMLEKMNHKQTVKCNSIFYASPNTVQCAVFITAVCGSM